MVISIGGASRADQFWKMRISGITDNGKHFFRTPGTRKKYHERVSTIADNRKEAILVTSTTRFGKM
jgi:hypothetical protein